MLRRQAVALRCVVTLLLCGAPCGCSCSGTVEDDECESAGKLTLQAVPPARVASRPGADLSVSAILVRQCVGVVGGENVHFDVVGFGDHAIPEADVQTDGRGIATTVVQVGSQEGTFQVQATALGADPINFTVDVAVPVLRLVVESQQPIQGVVSSRVSVTYKLTTSDAGGEIPVAGQPVRFSIDLGADTGSVLAEEAARTGPSGTATATLRTGATPGTVEVRGEVDGTSPATATILIEDGADGGCRRSADCQPGWECRLGREEDSGECAEVGGGRNPDLCEVDEDCEEGFECRDGRCLEPDFEGEVCEFDDECAEGELCIGGFCTPDPRDPPTCEDDADCGRLVCVGGQCICEDARHCPVGWVCADDGACVPPDGAGDGCVADRDCPDDQVCENGDCRDRGACEDPDLSGSWTFDSTLHLREALPEWLSDLLDAIDGPLRFLADGLLNGFEFDVPIIGDALEDAANGLADEYIPDWVGELLGAIADIAEIISTWQVQQDIELFSVGGSEYRGEEEWTRVAFELRGEEVSGTPEDILGWDVSVDDFNARTTCGTLNIDNHDVGIAVGSIIRWVLDVIVTFVSDGEYFSLEDLLYDLSDTICADLAWALQDLMEAIGDGLDIDLPDLESEFEDYCIEQAEQYIDQAITALEDIDVQLDVVEIAGQGAIVGEDRLDPGLWQGRLLGGDFDGEFVATRDR